MIHVDKGRNDCARGLLLWLLLRTPSFCDWDEAQDLLFFVYTGSLTGDVLHVIFRGYHFCPLGTTLLLSRDYALDRRGRHFRLSMLWLSPPLRFLGSGGGVARDVVGLAYYRGWCVG